VVRKAIIPLLALTAVGLASPTTIYARGTHHRSHVGLGHGPYGPPFVGYRPYADSCQSVRYRVATPSGSQIVCGWNWKWFN
jgi:hypothetical protein